MESYLPIVAPVLTVLWALICLRIYTMISAENINQRRLIAMGGALGSALIYLLASQLVLVLQAPSKRDAQPADDRIRIQAKP